MSGPSGFGRAQASRQRSASRGSRRPHIEAGGHRRRRTGRTTLLNDHQGIEPSSPKNPPVGPSAPSVARRTKTAAPCAGVRYPLWLLISVST